MINESIIDWELGIKLANNNHALAKEMLAFLMKGLPKELLDIKKAKEEKDFNLLLTRLHNLHGAVCYCGVPRLKKTIASLEALLKRKKFAEIPTLFSEFEQAVNQLFENRALLID